MTSNILWQESPLSWGGIPIILIIGDNYQLPFIEEESVCCFGDRPNTKHSPCKEFFIQHGFQQFLKLGKDVMQLTSPKRVHANQLLPLSQNSRTLVFRTQVISFIFFGIFA
jgi:hypothetical protein